MTLTLIRSFLSGAFATALLLCTASAHGQSLPSHFEVPVSSVAVGGSHACALTTTGGVRCWGLNEYGQLGDNSTTARTRPVDVVGLQSGVVALAAGYIHTCALLATGGVKCWGANGAGQLGDNTNSHRRTPVDVVDLSTGVASIIAGGRHNCALTTTGVVRCWGANASGQIGDGTMLQRRIPTNVIGLDTDIARLTGGMRHTCALMMDATLRCWGDNAYGQLGDGTETTRTTPAPVSGLTTSVMAVSASSDHTCALTDAGGALCWGQNQQGQLGDGSTTNRSVPTAVSGLTSGITHIDAGHGHTCAQDSTGALRCWGGNSQGQLGDGSLTDRLMPVAVQGRDHGHLTVATGEQHSCAIDRAGGLSCWGNNTHGQIGDGSTALRRTTTGVTGFGSGVLDVGTSSYYHSCVVTGSGGAMCWGTNIWGGLGSGDTVDQERPVPVVSPNTTFASISVGNGHSCAVTREGAAQCWGQNFRGQLGDGSFTNRLTPVGVPNIGTVVRAVSLNGPQSCARDGVGRVHCWGYNEYGNLGLGHTANMNIPQWLTGLPTTAQVSTGYNHGCALSTSGGLKCWGRNISGEVGNGSYGASLTPVDVVGMGSGVASVSATGGAHVCAITSAGVAKCWGSNMDGQLGLPDITLSRVPVDVAGLDTPVTAISAGQGHTCALNTTGGLKCWGQNTRGQLGADDWISGWVARDVVGLETGVARIEAGADHTCAVTTAGGLKCWGRNNLGQLGVGHRVDMRFPVNVEMGQALDFQPGVPGMPLASLPVDSEVLLTATTSAPGNALLTFASWTPTTCTVSGNTLTVTGAVGTLCGVSATREGGNDSRGGTVARTPTLYRLLTITDARALTVTVAGQGELDVAPDPAAGGGIDACTAASSPCLAGYAPDDASALTMAALPDAGWHVDNWSGDCVVDADDALRAHLTLDEHRQCHVGFAINRYEVVFTDWIGDVLDTQLVEHGAAADAPAPPEREGHTFIGWDVDFSVVTEDLVVAPLYEPHLYTVTFRDWDHSELDVQTVAHGQPAVAPTDPVRIGHTFTGWDVDFQSVESPLVITAQYQINTYTVFATVFHGHGVITPATQSVTFGGTATFTVTPHADWQTSHVTGSPCHPLANGDGSWSATNITADCTILVALQPARVLVVIDGDGQSTETGTAFAQPLQIRVTDADGTPLSGVRVNFAAPTSGASAVLSSTQATSDSNGLAQVFASANALAGSYAITATFTDHPTLPGTHFALSNTANGIALAVSIDNGREYSRYGDVVDYLIEIHNTGPGTAQDLDLTVLASDALDESQASWICLGPSSSGCTEHGTGPLAESNQLMPPGGPLTYVLSIPVQTHPAEHWIEATAQVVADSASDNASDHDLLVLLRDGFEQTEPVAAEPVPNAANDAMLTTIAPLRLIPLPPRTGGNNGTNNGVSLRWHGRIAGMEAATVTVQQLDHHGRSWLRVLLRDGKGNRIGPWLAVSPDALASLQLDYDSDHPNTRVLTLTIDQQELLRWLLDGDD